MGKIELLRKTHFVEDEYGCTDKELVDKVNELIEQVNKLSKKKCIYQVMYGHYDAPETEVLKTFTTLEGAEKYLKEVKETAPPRNNGFSTVYIESYELEE